MRIRGVTESVPVLYYVLVDIPGEFIKLCSPVDRFNNTSVFSYLKTLKFFKMKKSYILVSMAIIFAVMSVTNLFGQFYTNQVIIGNGGIYGDPSDHVTIATYNPEDETTTTFGDIQRESIQDLIIEGNFAYVAAEDSIVKYNIDTYDRIAAVYESNLSRLYLKNGKLFVSRRSDLNGPPADGKYVKVYDTEDLSITATVDGISADAAGMAMASDTLYVAVAGDWQATEGKFAVIDNNNNLVREMNFGADAIGISDLFTDGNNIYTVNKTPYGATTGSVTSYSVWTTAYTTTVLNKTVGKGVAVDGSTLYLLLDYGIGSYDLTNNQILNASIVPDPGSATFQYIAAAAFDNINQLFYVTITDYFSTGEGKIYDMTGNETGAFDAAVSAEAIAIDTRINDFTFDDVQYWVGEGENRALLVVDWNDTVSPESLAWGYRFDGEVTGEQILSDISFADSRFIANMSGGFLNDIAFADGEILHEGIGGTGGFYWSTWSGTNSGNWEMNAGIGATVQDGDWFGCSFTDFNPSVFPGVPVAVSNPVGIDNYKKYTEVSVYPNPATDFVTIKSLNINIVRLVNSTGIVIFENKYNSENDVVIDISGLVSGLYFVNVETDEGVGVNKLLVR